MVLPGGGLGEGLESRMLDRPIVDENAGQWPLGRCPSDPRTSDVYSHKCRWVSVVVRTGRLHSLVQTRTPLAIRGWPAAIASETCDVYYSGADHQGIPRE
jgi:hypothetical protein